MSTKMTNLRRIASLMVITILLISLTACFDGNEEPEVETTENLNLLEDSDGVLLIGPDGTIIFDFNGDISGGFEAESAREIWGTVVANGLNIRTGPGTQNDVCGSLNDYDRVQILDQTFVDDTLWGKTEMGWICMDYVLLDDPSQVLTNQETFEVVIRNNMNVHEGPGSHYDVIGTCVAGDRVIILETCGKWGRTGGGWICLDDVSRENSVGGDIVGSWYCRLAESGGGGYLYGIYTFSTDGTYSFLYAYLHTLYPGEYSDLGFSEGTYTYDGYTLTMESGSMAALIVDDTMALAEDDDVHIYYRGDLEDAHRDLAGLREETAPPAQEPPEEEPAETEYTEAEPEDTGSTVIDASIFGTWQIMRICDFCESGQCLSRNGYWTFQSDGTFTAEAQDTHYLYTPETGPVRDENAPGAGSQRMEGTYTFDGSNLILTYTFIEWEDMTGPVVETKWVTIRNGRMEMTDSYYTAVMYRGTVEEVADRLFAQ